ncbi:hypothetical protein BH20CHL7_BH20CHL7_12960 [soil metagenome]
MAEVSTPARERTQRAFASGVIAAGAVVLLISISPVIAFAAIALGIGVAAIGVLAARAARARYLAALAGFMIGSGSLFVLISWGAIWTCGMTADDCGQANPTPLLATGAALIVAGLVAGAGSVVVSRGSEVP